MNVAADAVVAAVNEYEEVRRCHGGVGARWVVLVSRERTSRVTPL